MHGEDRGGAKGSSRRAGFTVLELMVALALGAMIMLAARMLLENLADSAVHIERAAEEQNRSANGERLLRLLVRQIDPSSQRATFEGDETSARFSTWCQSATGWLRRCRVQLDVERRTDALALVAQLGPDESIVVRRAHRSLGLRYLLDARQGGTWFESWGPSLLSPAAIGIVADSDTIVVRIGEGSR